MKPALAIVLFAAPALALACPVCARDGTPHLALVLGTLIAAPYVVAVVVAAAIRGGGR